MTWSNNEDTFNLDPSLADIDITISSLLAADSSPDTADVEISGKEKGREATRKCRKRKKEKQEQEEARKEKLRKENNEMEVNIRIYEGKIELLRMVVSAHQKSQPGFDFSWLESEF